MHVKFNFLSQIKLICPVQPLSQKYFRFSEIKTTLYASHPVPHRGALAIVIDVGRVAVDAHAATDERGFERTAKACGPDIAVLVSSSQREEIPGRSDGGKKAVHRGEHEVALKPLRGEGRSVLR
jgi:hypothetical protein